MHDKEMVAMFIDMLQSPFYEHMVGSVSLNFADMVIIGERIEFGFKSEKIAQGLLATANTKKLGFVPGRRKEGEVQAASTAPHWGNTTISHFRPSYQQSAMHFVANTTPIYHPRARLQGFPRPRALYQVPPMPNNAYHHNVVPQPNQGQNQILTQKRNLERSFVNFSPILMSYTEFLPTLLYNSLVTILPMKSVQPPYPKNYDANTKRDYHDGAIAHSTERCFALKHKVQALIDVGWINFQEDKPNVEAKPLAVHASSSTNVVMEDEGYDMVRGIDMIQTPMKKIYTVLCQAGWLKVENRQENECGLHPGISHSIDECSKFKQILQDLIDRNMLQIYRQEKEGEVCTQIGEETTLSRPKPVVICFTKALHLSQERQPIVIQAPSPFLYKNEKAIPWKQKKERKQTRPLLLLILPLIISLA